MLSSSSPVTARTMSGGRAMPARSRTWISVASPISTIGPSSASSCSKRSRRCSTRVTSWPIRTSERVMFAPTLPPPATIAYMPAYPALPTGLGVARAHDVGEGRDRGLRRADRPQPALGVEFRAARVEDADDDAADVVAPLQNLADHDVRVVAVRRHHGGVRRRNARPIEHVEVHAVPDHEAAAPFAEPRRARSRRRRCR